MKYKFKLLLFFMAITIYGVSGQNPPETVEVVNPQGEASPTKLTVKSPNLDSPEKVDSLVVISMDSMMVDSLVPLRGDSLNRMNPDSVSVKGIVEQPTLLDTISIKGLKKILTDDLYEIQNNLSQNDLKYRESRILNVRKEETEFDLSFLRRLDRIRKLVAYETLRTSENFIVEADQLLDTLYNEDTDVSEKFKYLSKERYDNYVGKNKIIKIRIKNLQMERQQVKGEHKLYRYFGEALIDDLDKKLFVKFFSDGYLKKSDQNLIFELAESQSKDRVITIEGVIQEYQHGRALFSQNGKAQKPSSMLHLKEWLIMDRKILINDLRKGENRN